MSSSLGEEHPGQGWAGGRRADGTKSLRQGGACIFGEPKISLAGVEFKEGGSEYGETEFGKDMMQMAWGQWVEQGSSAQTWRVLRGRGLANDVHGVGRQGGAEREQSRATPLLGCGSVGGLFTELGRLGEDIY